MTWVLPRQNLPKNSLTTLQLLAAFWLDSEPLTDTTYSALDHLTSFVKRRQFKIPDEDLEQAAVHLENELIHGDIDQWVVFISFTEHPRVIWNFILDALNFAKTNDHLGKIAAGPAEILLGLNGSMIPHFESQAHADPKFATMLTGVWRHAMCDDTWVRLRALQAEVAYPLSQMMPLEYGVEHMADTMSPEDRATPDKGLYARNTKGDWVKTVG